jgi:hypothetical protein
MQLNLESVPEEAKGRELGVLVDDGEPV